MVHWDFTAHCLCKNSNCPNPRIRHFFPYALTHALPTFGSSVIAQPQTKNAQPFQNSWKLNRWWIKTPELIVVRKSKHSNSYIDQCFFHTQPHALYKFCLILISKAQVPSAQVFCNRNKTNADPRYQRSLRAKSSNFCSAYIRRSCRYMQPHALTYLVCSVLHRSTLKARLFFAPQKSYTGDEFEQVMN